MQRQLINILYLFIPLLPLFTDQDNNAMFKSLILRNKTKTRKWWEDRCWVGDLGIKTPPSDGTFFWYSPHKTGKEAWGTTYTKTKKRHFCNLHGLFKICLFMMTCMRHAEDPFMLIPHQSAFIIFKTLIILENLLMCKKVLASSVGCGAFSFIFLQLIFLSQKYI